MARDTLTRDPPLWFEARFQAVVALVALLVTALVWLGVTGMIGSDTQRIKNLRDVEWWLWMVVGIVTLTCINVVMMAAHKIRRAMTGRIPTVDVSNQPWRPGETAEVHIVDGDVGSVDELAVDLEARAMVSERDVERGTTHTVKVQHQARWLTARRTDLGSAGRLDQLLTVTVPHEAAGHPKWDWFIVVRGLREKSGVRHELHNDAYPIRVETE